MQVCSAGHPGGYDEDNRRVFAPARCDPPKRVVPGFEGHVRFWLFSNVSCYSWHGIAQSVWRLGCWLDDRRFGVGFPTGTETYQPHVFHTGSGAQTVSCPMSIRDHLPEGKAGTACNWPRTPSSFTQQYLHSPIRLFDVVLNWTQERLYVRTCTW
jgi:hypothetical protein